MAATSATRIPAPRLTDTIDASLVGWAVLVPCDIALALNAEKFCGPDSTALTEKTMPSLQCEVCRQKAQIGEVCMNEIWVRRRALAEQSMDTHVVDLDGVGWECSGRS
jgi:hypothetical protein